MHLEAGRKGVTQFMGFELLFWARNTDLKGYLSEAGEHEDVG